VTKNKIRAALFSDYDMSLVCSQKCDDVFRKCIAACDGSDCVMECNRDSLACTEGKFMLKVFK